MNKLTDLYISISTAGVVFIQSRRRISKWIHFMVMFLDEMVFQSDEFKIQIVAEYLKNSNIEKTI